MAGFTIDSLVWSPNHVAFQENTDYKASVGIVAKHGYRFPQNLKIRVNAGTVSGQSVDNSIGSFTVAFPYPTATHFYGNEFYLGEEAFV